MKIAAKIIIFLIDITRPFIAPSKCCIYSITCTKYAKMVLRQKSIFIAIPLIILRLLSCNPITVLFWKIKNYFSKYFGQPDQL